jgi:pimeloyl-ACP methyl ester carboxylesterase
MSNFISPEDGEKLITSSPERDSVWRMTQNLSGSSEANISITIDVSGTLRRSTLQLAINSLAFQHPILRSAFVRHQGQLSQLEKPLTECASSLAISIVHSAKELENASAYPFDISKEPPFRTSILSFGAYHHLLVLVFHRIAIDVWSLKPLVKDLIRSYLANAAAGSPVKQYRPGVATDLGNTENLGLQAHSPHRSERAIPSLHAAPKFLTSVKSVGLRLNSHVYKQISQLARECNTDEKTVLYAAVGILRRTNKPGQDSSFVIERSNRTSQLSRRLIGLYSALQRTRISLTDTTTFRQAVAYMHSKEAERDAQAYRNLLARAPDPAHSVSFQTSVDLSVIIRHSRDDLSIRLADYTLTVKSPSSYLYPFTLCLDLRVRSSPAYKDREIDGRVLYRSGVLSRVFVENFVSDFAQLLRTCLTTPDLAIEDLYCRRRKISGNEHNNNEEISTTAMSSNSSQGLISARDFLSFEHRNVHKLNRSAERTRYARATNPTHHMILNIWKELLGIDCIGIYDRFSDLGGDAKMLEVMEYRIQDRFGVKIPQDVLVGQITVDTITLSLVHLSAESMMTEARRRQTGDNKPLFLLHGDIDGGGYYSRAFASFLRSDRSVYVLNPHGMDGSSPPNSIGEMAESYIEMILAVQGEGPFHIAGYCNGGLAAFEIGRRLTLLNHLVGLVGLISTDVKSERPSSHSQWLERGVLTNSKRYFSLASTYLPQPYAGTVNLFLPTRQRSAEMHYAYWKRLARSVTVKSLKGSHTGCLTNHLQNLSGLVEDAMADTECHINH